ncbi:MAG TPA: hypothetical protein VIC05_05350 [Solirubrobacteraceae bacterium]|jgi:hypothetical protein
MHKEIPPKLPKVLIAGVARTLRMRVLEDKLSTLEDSLRESLYFALVPFPGHEDALAIASASEG